MHGRKEHGSSYIIAARILLDFQANDLRMGEEGVCRSPARIRVRVAGTAPLRSIVLVRNNEDLCQVDGRGWDQEAEWQDDKAAPGCWYYVRVIQQDGHMAWASPVWLD